MPDKAKLRLRSGREIALQELNQKLTYEGLVEGLPTAERNKVYLERLLDTGAKLGTTLPLLLPPRETPIEVERPYPFGTPSALPKVTCIARFASRTPARNKTLDYSELVVIWLQEEFAFPIDPVIKEQLCDLEWDRLATDLEI